MGGPRDVLVTMLSGLPRFTVTFEVSCAATCVEPASIATNTPKATSEKRRANVENKEERIIMEHTLKKEV
jgi:hypothetical protein